ncbi:DoxX family protein [Shewanella putrefaciens]|nr:DoxX family protein [Shewanella putrefaciens]
MFRIDGNITFNGVCAMRFSNLCDTKGQSINGLVAEVDTQKLFLCANTLNRAAATVTLAMSIVFFISGFAKLFGVSMVHVPFTLMNLPTGFGYFIGLMEVIGALGLCLRDYRVLSASGLLAIMMGAIYFHFNYEAPINALPALSLSAGLFLIIKLDEIVARLVRFQRQLALSRSAF